MFCEFCEISKNIFSYRTPPVAASFPSFLRSWVIRQLMKQPLYKVYYSRNQVLLYLWGIKLTLKRCIVSLDYFRDCTYLHTYLLNKSARDITKRSQNVYQTVSSFETTARKLLQFGLWILLIMIFIRNCWRKEKMNHNGRDNGIFNFIMKKCVLFIIQTQININCKKYIPV